MKLIDFKYIPVTTMTIIIELNGLINILNAFPLLEITRFKLEESIKRRKKIDIPYTKIPGAIISVTYMGITRGIVRSTNSKSFRNSITMDISTKEKNVNIKLSSDGIHLTGTTSIEMAEEATNYLIENLNEAQKILDYIKFHLDEARDVLQWVKEKTKGSSCYVVLNTDMLVLENDIIFLDQEELERLNCNNKNIIGYVPVKSIILNGEVIFKDAYYVEKTNYIIIPDEFISNKYPEHLNMRLIKFFIEKSPDFSRHDFYCINLDWILTVDKIFEGPLGINKMQKAMVNYNYDLGFNIDRYELYNRINGVNGFFSRYENTSDHCVTIQLKYNIPTNLNSMIKKKNKSKKHSFLVYKSGLVTQSGPCEELSKDSYELFLETIESLRPHIDRNSKGNRKFTFFKIDHIMKMDEREKRREEREEREERQ